MATKIMAFATSTRRSQSRTRRLPAQKAGLDTLIRQPSQRAANERRSDQLLPSRPRARQAGQRVISMI